MIVICGMVLGHGDPIKSGLMGNMHRETPKLRPKIRSNSACPGDLDICSQSDWPKKQVLCKRRIELETTRSQTNRSQLQGHLDALSSFVILNLDSSLNCPEQNAKFSPKFRRIT